MVSSYSCTAKVPCEKGFVLLKLLRSNLKDQKCVTSVEQLEEVSKQMKSLECKSFVNESLQLQYARYLCSRYNVKYGFNEITSITDENEKEVDITHDDLTTSSYVKGLDLYGQLLLTTKRSEDTRCNEFIKYLRRLKIEGKSLQIYDDAINNILPSINTTIKLDPNEPKDRELIKYFNITDEKIIKSLNKKMYMKPSVLSGYIIKLMFFKIKSLNNQNINDGLFMYYFDLFQFYNVERCLINRVKKIYDKGAVFSDGMKYLYFFALGTQYTTKKTSLMSVLESLQSRIDTGIPIKTKGLEFLFYYRIGQIYQTLNQGERAITYFEYILSSTPPIVIAKNMCAIYDKLKNYDKASEHFKMILDAAKASSNKKAIQKINQYHLYLLEKAGRQEKYDRFIIGS